MKGTARRVYEWLCANPPQSFNTKHKGWSSDLFWGLFMLMAWLLAFASILINSR